jgi:hypothetical protein
MKQLAAYAAIAMSLLLTPIPATAASVKPGDLITPENAAAVDGLVSPGNLVLVRQGMRLKIVAPQRLEWPPPYKTATEKYSPQVRLNDKGELENYVAGQPFPIIDPNDQQAATKVMWNFSYRPQYTDDVDIRNVAVESYRASEASATPVERMEIGHFAFYDDNGRTEVPPIPTDPDAIASGLRYRFGAFPFLAPEEVRGFGLIRERNINPAVEDNAWFYSPRSRKVRRVTADTLSDAMGPLAVGVGGNSSTYANTLDPDSYFGFSAKIEDYNYRLLGIKPMLACVHAGHSPAVACQFDGNRTVCPEDWEMRRLYVVGADAKPLSWHQRIGSSGVSIPKRILYIDSEGWFITASDQYDREGKLWKTIATFNTYRDRPVPDAKVAIYPYKRMFQTALADEDVQTGFSTVVYMPAHEMQDKECWYINMGIVTKGFLDPRQMSIHGH